MRKPESPGRSVRCIAKQEVRQINAFVMPAIAEILSTVAMKPDPRGCDLPTCPVCADSMVAAEASAYLNDHVISYLWTCDTCGYGFVTKHSVKRFACN